MPYELAGSFAGVAYFPTESELSRKFKQIIGATLRWVEGLLCKSTSKR